MILKRIFNTSIVMSDADKRNKASLRVAAGAILLIILLLLWLTYADLWGDTDVAAFLTGPIC